MPSQDALLHRRTGATPGGDAQSGPMQQSHPIKLAIISEGVSSTWPLYVAQAKRLFEHEGLRVDVTITASSYRQLEALKKGEFDIGFQQADHVVRAVENGSDLFIFMALGHAPDLTLVALPGIRDYADLRHRDIAVDGARSGYALLLRKWLATKGLRDGDYRFVEIGGAQQRCEALQSGKAVASLLNAPFDRDLIAAGFRSLGTTGQYFPGYVGAIAAARRTWAEQHRSALVSFIRAMDLAYDWLRDSSHRDEAIAILLARLQVDPAEAAKAFERDASRERPVTTDDGLRRVIEIVWDAEALTLPPAQPGKYVDWSYSKAARS